MRHFVILISLAVFVVFLIKIIKLIVSEQDNALMKVVYMAIIILSEISFILNHAFKW